MKQTITQKLAERTLTVQTITSHAKKLVDAGLEDGASREARKLADIAGTWLRFQDTLAEAKAELACNPVHWLAWAGNFAGDAVEADLCEQVMRSEKPMETIRLLRERMTYALLNDEFSGRCTGAHHRAMDDVKREVYSRMLRQLFAA